MRNIEVFEGNGMRSSLSGTDKMLVETLYRDYPDIPFTDAQLKHCCSHNEGLHITQRDRLWSPLWFHERGLQETASGYGRKLHTPYMLCVGKRLYRVYCCIFSNSGTRYIQWRGHDIIVH